MGAEFLRKFISFMRETLSFLNRLQKDPDASPIERDRVKFQPDAPGYVFKDL